MNSIASYPGTPKHQAILQAIVTRYENDPRILAVVLFGSLVRGNWDSYSDIDCDIVVADDVHIDTLHELRSLRNALANAGEEIAFIIPDHDDAGDIQLSSLMQISIRYHPLAHTSPDIVRNMMVLSGELDNAVIASVGEANRRSDPSELTKAIDVLIRYAVVASICIQRKQVWTTLEILQRMRTILMNIFARTHGAERGYQFFDKNAPQDLQDKMAATLSLGHVASLRACFIRLLDIIEDNLSSVADGDVRLTDAHRLVLKAVRRRICLD
jgi:predicted nucleotidyltransferase